MISKEERALALRFVVFLLASIGLMLTDHNTDYLKTIRAQLLGGVYPIQYLMYLLTKQYHFLLEILCLTYLVK